MSERDELKPAKTWAEWKHRFFKSLLEDLDERHVTYLFWIFFLAVVAISSVFSLAFSDSIKWSSFEFVVVWLLFMIWMK